MRRNKKKRENQANEAKTQLKNRGPHINTNATRPKNEQLIIRGLTIFFHLITSYRSKMYNLKCFSI